MQNGNDISQENQAMLYALSTLTNRLMLGKGAGVSYGGKRDLYNALGYNTNLTFRDYYSSYRRDDICQTIIDIKPDTTWRNAPEVTEDENEETEFESQWDALKKRRRLHHFIHKADRLSGIGCYGVIFLGFNDANQSNLKIEAQRASDLLYLNCFHEENAKIKTWNKNKTSERFGLPETYEITITTEETRTEKIEVHWSRIIHIAENTCEGEVFGTPRLEPLFNRLNDLLKIVGGSGEMFWRGAYPGINFGVDADTKLDPDDKEAMKEQIDEYMHNFRRFLLLKGVDPEVLQSQLADPSKHFDIQMSIISAVTRIPKRILLGSERGELASSQDERAWLQHIEERRQNHAEPNILRPFIDRLIKVGVLTEPKEGYTVKWKPLLVKDDKEKAEINKIKTETIAAYGNSMGAEMIVPPKFFLRNIMGFSEDEVIQIEEELGELVTDTDETE